MQGEQIVQRPLWQRLTMTAAALVFAIGSLLSVGYGVGLLALNAHDAMKTKPLPVKKMTLDEKIEKLNEGTSNRFNKEAGK